MYLEFPRVPWEHWTICATLYADDEFLFICDFEGLHTFLPEIINWVPGLRIVFSGINLNAVQTVAGSPVPAKVPFFFYVNMYTEQHVLPEFVNVIENGPSFNSRTGRKFQRVGRKITAAPQSSVDLSVKRFEMTTLELLPNGQIQWLVPVSSEDALAGSITVYTGKVTSLAKVVGTSAATLPLLDSSSSGMFARKEVIGAIVQGSGAYVLFDNMGVFINAIRVCPILTATYTKAAQSRQE
jgi:hypothetical protein